MTKHDVPQPNINKGRIECPKCSRYCANKASYSAHYIRAHIIKYVRTAFVGDKAIAHRLDRKSDYIILFDETKCAFGDHELSYISSFLKDIGIKCMFLFVNDVNDAVRFVKIPKKNAKS